MTGQPTIHAIVLAGGRSERMGMQKLAIRLGSRTVLERVVDAIRNARVDSILVVLGPTALTLQSLIDGHAEVLSLADQTRDMRATIEHAIHFLEVSRSPTSTDGVLVCLGDQPTLNPSTVRQLIEAYQIDPGRPVIPIFDGHRGHPIIIPWSGLERLRGLPPNLGLNAVLRDPATQVAELATTDADILLDLDVPSDLERLSKRFWD